MEPPIEEVAGALQVSIGLLLRRLRQVQADGDLTLSELAALARLDRGGAATAAALAKAEGIRPQSMGATLAALQERGLVERRADPEDGRRVLISLTAAGSALLRSRRSGRTELLARGLADGFTPDELAQLMAAAPLIERLGQRV